MADNETACGNGVQPGPSPGRRCFVGRRNHPNQPTHPRTQTLARFPPDRPGLMASVRRVAIAFHTLVCHIQLARSWVTCRSWSMASPESGEQRPRRAGDHTGLDVRALAWSRNQAVPRRCQGPSAGSADSSPRTGSEELTEMGSGHARPRVVDVVKVAVRNSPVVAEQLIRTGSNPARSLPSGHGLVYRG